MSDQLADVLLVVGRVLLGGVFLYGGIEHFFVLSPLTRMMSKRGVLMPLPVLIIGSIFQGVLGLMLMLGVFVVWACLGLVIFTIAATIMLLNFWDMDGSERAAAKNTAVLNTAVIGGLIVAASQAMK